MEMRLSEFSDWNDKQFANYVCPRDRDGCNRWADYLIISQFLSLVSLCIALIVSRQTNLRFQCKRMAFSFPMTFLLPFPFLAATLFSQPFTITSLIRVSNIYWYILRNQSKKLFACQNKDFTWKLGRKKQMGHQLVY